MFAQGIAEIDWVRFLTTDDHAPQTFDSLDFTRQKSISKDSQSSKYELVKMNS